jgi:HPt (histidine-containing phosphotransfer) domain-containing protein
MNNLKTSYTNNPQAYKHTLQQLAAELRGYHAALDHLHAEQQFDELRPIAHTIRNIAGAIGQTKLKIVATYWEDLCIQKRLAPVQEFKQSIEETVQHMETEINTL